MLERKGRANWSQLDPCPGTEKSKSHGGPVWTPPDSAPAPTKKWVHERKKAGGLKKANGGLKQFSVYTCHRELRTCEGKSGTNCDTAALRTWRIEHVKR